MRGRGFRKIRLAPVILASLSACALAAPSRHIPRGELTPQVIEKAYDSPRGEVQFTVIESTSVRSAFLRSTRGHLLGFTEVRGGRDCEEWFLSSKAEAPPRRCEFLFYDNLDGRYLSVRSDELEESTLFDLASTRLRGMEVARVSL